MARLDDHKRALELRKTGKSYSQIKQLLGVSKSTLSEWLKDYPLSHQDLEKLSYKNEVRIEKYRQTMRNKRNDRLQKIYNEQKDVISILSNREIFIAGLFLYWGEGSKTKFTSTRISNTNPAIIKFFIFWAIKLFNIPRDKFKIMLHLYSDMDVEKELRYWSKILRFSLKQFYRPYIKNSSSKDMSYKGSYGHGTCNVVITNTNITEKILMSIKVIENNYK